MDEKALKAARDSAALAWEAAGRPKEGPERDLLTKSIEDLARAKREKEAPSTTALDRLSEFAKRGGKVVSAKTERSRPLVAAERRLRKAYALPRLGQGFPADKNEQEAVEVLSREYGSVRLALVKLMPAAAHIAA